MLERVPMPLPFLDSETEAPRGRKRPQGHRQLQSRLPSAAEPRHVLPPPEAWCLPPLCPFFGSQATTLTGPETGNEPPPLSVPQFPPLQNEEAGPDQGFPRCCGCRGDFTAMNSHGNSGCHTDLTPHPGDRGAETGPARAPFPQP